MLKEREITKVAMEKREETRRNFLELTNIFRNDMCFADSLMFQLAG